MASKKTVKQPGDKRGISARAGRAKENVTRVTGAATAGGRACADGIVALNNSLGNFRRGLFADAGQHIRSTVKAKNLHEVVSLQAAWVQQRIGTNIAQVRELTDLSCTGVETVIARISEYPGSRGHA